MARAATGSKLRRRRCGGGQGARRARARGSAREPSQDQSRQGAPRARPSQARADAALARGPAHRHAPGRPRAAARPPGPTYVKGLVEVAGTRVRSSPRSSRKPSPRMQVLDLCAGRGAARRHGARRRDWRTGRDRSTPPTPTRIALRRFSPGSPARALEMSRCGRREGKRMCSATSKDAAISC